LQRGPVLTGPPNKLGKTPNKLGSPSQIPGMMEVMFRNKKVSVIGLGKTGVSAANLLSELGARVFVSDISPENEIAGILKTLKNDISYETGKHTERVLDAELIIRSPGAPSDLPILTNAKEKQIPVWSELELATRLINPKLLIAITGTNGKTTTTLLTGEILKNAGLKTIVAGNIGRPLSDFVHEIDSSTVVVLEVSSYQLENVIDFKPDICCILNIKPDHIEHHKTMENYIEAKTHIFKNQESRDYCILNYNDDISRNRIEKNGGTIVFFSKDSVLKNGIYCINGTFFGNLKSQDWTFTPKLIIPGEHNVENALASSAIAALVGVPKNVIESTLNNFRGVEHRLEFVRELNRVKYINDSKSTNVDSTVVALKSFNSPIVLIMGGRDKGFPYKPLLGLVKDKVRLLLLIGESAEKIHKELNNSTEIIHCGDLKTAVQKSYEKSGPGDIVLFSPGGSSFDQFKNFEDRGNRFKEYINCL